MISLKLFLLLTRDMEMNIKNNKKIVKGIHASIYIDKKKNEGQ